MTVGHTMSPAPLADVVASVTIPNDCLDDFRLMLREQLVDDEERLRDIRAGIDSTPPAAVRGRIAFVWTLAEQVGGIY